MLENLKTEEKSTWGGFREGSGRKPRLQYEARDLFNTAIDKEWDNMLESILKRVREGDKDMIKWVIEQRIGKAPQSMDINAMEAILNVSEPLNDTNKIDIMSMAKEISERIRKYKTD